MQTDSEDDNTHSIDSTEQEEQFIKSNPVNMKIDVRNDRYPCCIVWTPIPLITWLFPFVGHMGIANSQGIIYDFAGPYYISVDNFAFGAPTKYIQLDPSKVRNENMTWDQCVEKSRQCYSKKMYNFFLNNCHNYVQMCLNEMEYDGRRNWGVVELAGRSFFQGKHVSTWRTIKTYIGFVIIVTFFLFVALVLPNLIYFSVE